MKNKVLLLLFLLPLLIHAQEAYYECGLTEFSSYDPTIIHSGSINPADYENADPLVINVKYWKVNDPNGDFYTQFTERQLLEGIAHLNINFNQFNIFFKYRGWDEFDSPNNVLDRRWEDGDNDGDYECITYPDPDPNGYTILDRCQIGSLFSYARNPSDGGDYRDETAMNIYITSWNTGFGNAAAGLGVNQYVMKIGSLKTTGMVHEMGHALGLGHTRSVIDEDPNTISEHITRDPFDVNFNAFDTADRILDTAANPGFRKCDANGGNCYPWITEDCLYDLSSTEQDESVPRVDFAGTIFSGDVQNALGDAWDCNDAAYLSPGQGIYMRDTIEQDPVLISTLTNVASLFEPYSGEYYIVGPQPTLHPPLFQPGFEYRFVECEGDFPAPAPYGTIFPYDINTVLLNIANNETDFTSITHPNHSAILIKHETGGNDIFPKAEKCYNNFNKASSGGLVLKFNDNVFNTNVTVTVQDSTAINSSNLIQNLEQGLYKIEKNYEDGSIQETIVVKENN